MSKVLVDDSSLSGIGSAIRSKNGSSTYYKPSEMAAAINAISAGVTPTGTVNITQNGTTDVTQYASAVVNVPNSYSSSDEGKVVSNGLLVAQTARASEITQNGTYDTTNNSSVSVNVEGGSDWGSVAVATVKYTGSFIDSVATLNINSSGYPNYAMIVIDLQDYYGCIIQIVNSGGDRNYYGVYNSIVQGQTQKLGKDRLNTNGILIFSADQMLEFGRYLVYDYTSNYSSHSEPQVSAWQKVQAGNV